MLTQGERDQMAQRIAEIRALIEKAEATAAGKTAGGFLSGLFGSEVAPQLAGVVRMGRETFDKWAGPWKTWAERGKDDQGQAYPVTHWERIGRDLGSQLSGVTQSYFDASNFRIVVATVGATGATVGGAALAGMEAAGAAAKKIAEPWPLSVKVGLWAVGATALLGAGGYALAQVNALPIPRLALPRRGAA